MSKVLLIAAIFALWVAVACSGKDGLTATVVPEPLLPTADNTAATDDLVLPTPTFSDTAAANAQQQPVPPAESRQGSPAGRGFVPSDNPTVLAAHENGYFVDDELILGVEWARKVRAYAVRILRYHHVVTDTVGGEPLLFTY